MKIAVLTGAGISAESGIKTFRDSDGLWEGHDIYEVASPQGWQKNKSLVLDFYNKRRAQLAEVKPNKAHFALAKLQEKYEVVIITQNVDDLHERAGSKNIIHLHGELTKSQSTINPNLVYDIGTKPINLGDKCEMGSQLRPFIVWFGEAVPKIVVAMDEVKTSDILIIIGTSMQVYPAAGLVEYAKTDAPIYYIDPKPDHIGLNKQISIIPKKATIGVEQLVNELINNKK